MFTIPFNHPYAAVQGDANNDGHVDGTDYIIWLKNYGKIGVSQNQADFNQDGTIDSLDYSLWLNSYGFSETKPDYTGVWSIFNSTAAFGKNHPSWYKGHLISIDWKDLEPVKGQFNWGLLDNAIQTISSNNLYVMFKVYVGPDSPDWIYKTGVYSEGVTKIMLTNGQSVPYYFDPNYLPFVKDEIQEVADHIDTYPATIRNKIVAMQCPAGRTGDDVPYDNTLLPPGYEQYAINNNSFEWRSYVTSVFQTCVEAYKNKTPVIPVIVNPGEDQTLNNTVLEQMPNTWRKITHIGQEYPGMDGYNELHKYNWVKPMLTTLSNNLLTRGRAEFSVVNREPSFMAAPDWNMYWMALWNLQYGLDFMNLNVQEFKLAELYPAHQQSWDSTFTFFDTYAGVKNASQSPGAWIALRDGLDAADTVRFPVDAFGADQNGKNAARYVAIVNEFATDGAKQDDPAFVTGMGMGQAKGMNDVTYGNYDGNYQMFMSQIDPIGTSLGMWRVGSQSERFGRYARRFDHTTGKDSMYFDIDDAFFSTGNRDYPITISVTYFDQGTGQWSLDIDNKNASVLTVQKTNSNQWLQKQVTISAGDWIFNNIGAKGSDITLTNDDSEDDIFHMIEITRNINFTP